jgi:hypothetical protein
MNLFIKVCENVENNMVPDSAKTAKIQPLTYLSFSSQAGELVTFLSFLICS